ncbi:MAG: division/cell wall cluster transcriptional repressor MraZ [Gammaproteobacteria bacterium]|nr:division/cell wall cluster transcriptional repressor MraZ [Gammaproteobacteria bacterium]
MFRGNASVALDSKGRMAIPTKYRDKLKDVCDERLVVTIHPKDKCLMLYPLNQWVIKEETLNNVKSLDVRTAKLQRFFLGNATDCEMDGQGRILIPESHRNYAGLTKNLSLVGLVNRFEIWDREQWDTEGGVLNEGDIDNLADIPGLEEFTF